MTAETLATLVGAGAVLGGIIFAAGSATQQLRNISKRLTDLEKAVTKRLDQHSDDYQDIRDRVVALEAKEQRT